MTPDRLAEALACPTCEGKGYEVEERIRSVAGHHPSCVGGSECASSCPIEVPYPEYEQVPCSSCNGTGINFPTDEDVEAAAREFWQLDEKTRPTHFESWTELGGSLQEFYLVGARAALEAVRDRWLA